jgi:tetratricopeptide (TPR) repeat protein
MTTLALSMIVRDAAGSLGACLESVQPVVNEICIADTGSTDATLEIAKRFGARVLSIPWTNNFAEARNRALQDVATDWVLSLDADEQLDAQAPRQIRELLSKNSVAGCAVAIRNYVLSLDERVWDRPATPNDGLLPSAAKYPAFVEHENIRLFRRDPDIYFVGRVHESVGPRLQELRRTIVAANFCIHHFGLAADAETRARKNSLYRELGRQKIHEMPDNAQAFLELGIVELDNFRNLSEALALFQRACELNPRLGIAWFFAGVTLVKLERCYEALEALAQAEKCGHATALVAETRADAFYNLGRIAESGKAYTLALRRDPANLSLQSKLALAEVRSGHPGPGLDRLRRALRKTPTASELHDRLILALVSLERLPEAAIAAEQKLNSITRPEAKDYLRAASLCAKAGQLERCAALLERGLLAFPEHATLQQAVREAAPASATPYPATSLDR